MNTQENMLYLCLCAIKGVKPSEEILTGLDFEELYRCSCGHKVTALVCHALEKIISVPEVFAVAKTKAVRKDMLLSAEYEKISAFLVEKGIAHLPLKGMILKDYYPAIGLREMSDVDIFYEKKYREDIYEYMLSIGYDCVSRSDSQDAYTREPVYNIEMHHQLFLKSESESLFEYYREAENRFTSDEKSPFTLKMSSEDFYIYIIHHEYKHFSSYGTGVRSLFDIIILLFEFEKTLDWDYIGRELEKTGLRVFEEKQRILCKKLMETDYTESLDDEEKELLRYFLTGGAYGNTGAGIVNKLTGQTGNKDRKVTFTMKIKYVFSRVFPPVEYYRTRYPFFYKHKLLIPFCVIYRVFLAIFRRNDFVKSEVEILRKSDKKT